MKALLSWDFSSDDFRKYLPFLDIDILTQNKSFSINDYDVYIFPGGEDVDPNIYGKPNTFSTFINRERDYIEKTLFEKIYMETDKLIIGVCRGHQLINAILGGKIIQDLHFEGYRQHPRMHGIDAVKSPKNFALKELSAVTSYHHQAVAYPGSGMNGIHIYRDVWESCESKDGRILTVQFHPEFDFNKAWGDGVGIWTKEYYKNKIKSGRDSSFDISSATLKRILDEVPIEYLAHYEPRRIVPNAPMPNPVQRIVRDRPPELGNNGVEINREENNNEPDRDE